MGCGVGSGVGAGVVSSGPNMHSVQGPHVSVRADVGTVVGSRIRLQPV